MAKQSPYALSKTEGHVLSEYARRSATPIEVKELRLSINGWTTQTLIHDCSTIASIMPGDLLPYIRDKGYDVGAGNTIMDKFAAKLIGALQGSVPLMAEYVPGHGMWRLGVHPLSLPWPAELDLLAQTIRNERKAATDYMFHASFDANPRWCSHVPTWRIGSNGDALVERLVAAGMERPTDEVKQRVIDPVRWFEKRLSAAGVPMEYFKYEGVYDACRRVQQTGPVGSMTEGIPSVYAGGTRLVGPADSLGFRPIWTGPQLGDVLLWVCDAFCGTQNSPGYTAMGCRWKTYHPGITTTKLTAAELAASCPGSGFDISTTLGFATCYEGPVSAVYRHGTSGIPGYGNYPYTSALSSLLPFASATWVSEKLAGAASQFRFFQSKWLVAKPHGIIEWRHQATVYVNAGSASDGYGLDTWSASPSSVMFRLSMAAVREHIALQLTRDDLTPVDRAKLERAQTESASYADAVISVTVSDTSVSSCSLLDVQALDMVRAAKKGDVDLMGEDLGNGVTLTTLGKRLDALRTKGRKFCTYGHVVDEVAVTTQLVSARVAGTMASATSWDLALVVNELEGPLIYGKYSSGPSEMLTTMEAALLWIRGARSSDGTLTVPVFADTLALGGAWEDELTQLGATKLIGDGSGRAVWGSTKLHWDKFSAHNFCDYEGFPVVGFTDKDTLVRQQLLFKSGESDPADLACAIFFANQLSFAV